MPTTFFLVRAVVAPNLREKFDHRHATDHLPWAVRAFQCEKAWRFWSALEPGVHYAVYRFADKASCDAALGSAEFKALVADFDRNFPQGVSRTRDVLTLAEERKGAVILMVRSAAKRASRTMQARASSFETPASRAPQDEE